MSDTITIRKPDDWHLHVRDNEMMRASLSYTAAHFGRAIMMPNLIPPVRTVADAQAYRERILSSLPEGAGFTPLMTAYLTDDTDPDDIERGFRDGVLTGVKLYPANATTNSAAGVTDFARIVPVLERMEKIGMMLLIHGEEVLPEVDVFDREAVFIERRLAPMLKSFPGLKIVLEHLSTSIAVDFVRSAAPQLGGTITPYHLQLNRTDWLGAGNRPYMYCMPVIKRESDRLALREAATSGDACFFLGTDSAPHAMAKKLAVVGAAGVYNAPVAIETYAQVFDEEGSLDKLEAFASLNGARHYGLTPNEATITLKREPWTAPEEILVEGPEERALCYRGGETIPWRVVG
ncbi:dihydroorotase [Ancylobacter sp. MQZ15Z-1]|uniref:Dihydroorotase n=1 Tax=Ancylobacter mangrovi TaxID=2972472 RepID=A0A9X2T7X7_9HYPH|nr:dihydroorotase [Ancylobacter mangrovi]MCS0496568.1 dihydroorotase [Ancylobacter mangrovi]